MQGCNDTLAWGFFVLMGYSEDQMMVERATDKENTEEAMRFTRFAIDHVSDAAFWMGPDARFTYVNDAACDTLGYSREELLSMAVHDIDPDFPKDVWPEHWRRQKKEGALVFESRHRTKDGRVFPVEIATNYVEFGGKEYSCAFARNITHRKLAEETLRKSQATLSSIFAAAPIGIGLVSNRILEQVNGQICQMTGYSEEELLNQNARILYPSDKDFEYVGREKYRQIAEKGTGTVETRWQKKNGEIVNVLMSSTPLDPKDLAAGVTFTALDITEAKLAQADKARVEKKLQQAQKMEAIGTLAGGIAHDFNNILGAIIGYTELVQTKLPQGSQEWTNLSQVLRAADRAKNLVTQILAFSRQSEKEEKPIQLGPIVKEALKMLRASIPTTIDIQQHFQPESGTVFADPTQIHQVLMNLCANAAHAMGKTGGTLTITMEDVVLEGEELADHPGLKAGPYVQLIVSDTGHGMPHEVKERIFDPYFTTKEKGVGTGLGLAVVHGIVARYKGAVSVESEPGKGTTFTVFFPRIAFEAFDEEPLAEPLPRGTECILFVDDEETLTDIAKQMLERLGYTVIVRTNPTEARELFRKESEKIDLVITDQTMPKLTGEMLAKDLMDCQPHIPIVLCTGYSDLMTRVKTKALGIRAFVSKPLVMRELAFTIRKVLEKP
jgi:PAS domain S-box-containing protein